MFARRWCWRQSDQSAAREDTQNIVVTVEAHHANAKQDVEAAIQNLTGLLGQFAGGQLRSEILVGG